MSKEGAGFLRRRREDGTTREGCLTMIQELGFNNIHKFWVKLFRQGKGLIVSNRIS
jgi:hypothetical protein